MSQCEQDLSTKWPGMTRNLILDIFGVHKALLFGQFQRSVFTFADFEQLWEKAKVDILREDIPLHSGDLEQFSLSFFPKYLIKDSIKSVMTYHFAVSAVVDRIVRNWHQTDGMRIRSVVVPAAICSRYDIDDPHQPSIYNMDDFMRHISCSIHHIVRKVGPAVSSAAPKLTELLVKMLAAFGESNMKDIGIVFLRKNTENDDDFVWIHVFECTDWSNLSELDNNYFLSFDFRISHVVRCWLHFGAQQRLRFYPEYVVWIIPNLFVRSTTLPQHQLLKMLYSDRYKHGWRVNLDDPTFNKYYHIITGYEHVSNNYHRDVVQMKKSYVDDDVSGLRDHLEIKLGIDCFAISSEIVDEEAYDSDAILQDVLNKKKQFEVTDSNIMLLRNGKSEDLRNFKFAILHFEKMDCKLDAVRDIDECQHIKSVIQNLQKFQRCNLEIDAGNVLDFDLDSIIRSFDHLVQVHGFLSNDEDTNYIQQYVAERVRCDRHTNCAILMKYSGRVRERESIEDKKEEPMHEMDELIEPIVDTLYAVHCYVLHEEKENDYFRLPTNQTTFMSRYSTTSTNDTTSDLERDEEKTPEEINCGRNVLQWLPYGHHPRFKTLKEEIIQNPESTIDRALFREYEVLCIAKIRGTKYEINEMLSLKLYSDSSKMQTKLSRAHWTVADLVVRKSYYNWAMGLYEAHLYHAKPIPPLFGFDDRPSRLWHGLNQLLAMNSEMPTYYGPISTTVARAVAKRFSKNQGLIWLIQPSYVNPLRFVVGIKMQWISSFKHEKEVLLYNQCLPIQSTVTFDDDPKVLIEHLMYSLQSLETPIEDSRAFWRQLGVHFSPAWIPSIVNQHRDLLFAKSRCDNLIVLDRLSDELQLSFFQILKRIQSSCYVTANNEIALMDDASCSVLQIDDFMFIIGLSERNTEWINYSATLRFWEFAHFSIECETAWKLFSGSLIVHLFCKPVDGSFDFVPLHSMTLPRYHFSTNEPLMIAESADIHDDTLLIRSLSDIVIEAGTSVAVSGCEIRHSADCVAIRIISNGTVTNMGSLSCTGAGVARSAIIYIVADTFLNGHDGKLECAPDGEIIIFCRKYINNGMVSPQPTVIETHQYGDYSLIATNYLLHCIQREFTIQTDLDKDAFLKRIGIEMKTQWIPLITDHEMVRCDDAHLSVTGPLSRAGSVPKDSSRHERQRTETYGSTTFWMQENVDMIDDILDGFHSRHSSPRTSFILNAANDCTLNDCRKSLTLIPSQMSAQDHGQVLDNFSSGSHHLNEEDLQKALEYEAKMQSPIARSKRIIDILGNTLDIPFFRFYAALKRALIFDHGQNVVLRRNCMALQVISEYVFAVGSANEDEMVSGEYQFQTVEQFKIPCEGAAVVVYCKPIDGSFGFARIKSLELMDGDNCSECDTPRTESAEPLLI